MLSKIFAGSCSAAIDAGDPDPVLVVPVHVFPYRPGPGRVSGLLWAICLTLAPAAPALAQPASAPASAPAPASRPAPATPDESDAGGEPAGRQSGLSGSATELEAIQVQGNWLGSDTTPSIRTFPGARTTVDREEIEASGAVRVGDVLRRVPGLQSTDNSGTAGSSISLNIGVRGLTGRYSPRSTVLLDGLPMGVAPYGQPQLSFAPVSLNNIETIDVLRGGGAVRYGPQNVGGIINFKTRAIPTNPGLSGDASIGHSFFRGGEGATTYSAFVGSQLDSGLGFAILYSGLGGSGWRKDSDDRYTDLAIKFRYLAGDSAEIYGKFAYYDVRSRTPGGLSVAEFRADPFQNTRPTDYWEGERKAFDIGYLNTVSATREVEVRTYYNDSSRASALINTARTQITHQPRNYEVFGFEPRFTERFAAGVTTHDVTVGYRFLRERGDDNNYAVAVATGIPGATSTFDNSNDAHSIYLDDKIAWGAWRITPGIRFEKISSTRTARATASRFESDNTKALPSLNLAWLLSPETTVYANYNTSFGAVQNTQLNSQTAANPLRPEVARTIEAGGRWQTPTVNAELTAYRIHFDNQIQQIPGTTPAIFRNVGATRHTGIEAALAYHFDPATPLAGLSVFANFAYTRALQESGDFAGRDLPFYSRVADTLGANYETGPWGMQLSTTHLGSQYSDNENTVEEAADASTGRVPGWRIWNIQGSWIPQRQKGIELRFGVNNLTDKRYWTRNVDGNFGRMVAMPRTVYVQGRYWF